ncbi:MAG: GTPase Era [Thermodesulfobacteriota bacterium]
MHDSETVKCGMVALVGPPNVGKSTLMNTLLGQKISIVSPKPQTTRNRILGIVNGDDHQIVVLDTPGLHRAKSPLNREMMRIALETLPEVDVIVFMVDATLPPPAKETSPTRYLEKSDKPCVLLLNKVDLIAKERLLPLLQIYGQLHPFTAMIPVSALAADGIDEFLAELKRLLPEGQRLYPEDIPTDASERFIVGELIREKVFLLTREEIPYATAVTVDSFQEPADGGAVTIHATIMVEKQSQKGIIIGKQGSMLKRIGEQARREIEKLLDQKVMLKLWVRVQKDWTSDPRVLRDLGF